MRLVQCQKDPVEILRAFGSRRSAIADVDLIIDLLRMMPPESAHFARAKNCISPTGGHDGRLGHHICEFYGLNEWTCSVMGIDSSVGRTLLRFFAIHPDWWNLLGGEEIVRLARATPPVQTPSMLPPPDPVPISLRGGGTTKDEAGHRPGPGMMEAGFGPFPAVVGEVANDEEQPGTGVPSDEGTADIADTAEPSRRFRRYPIALAIGVLALIFMVLLSELTGWITEGRPVLETFDVGDFSARSGIMVLGLAMLGLGAFDFVRGGRRSQSTNIPVNDEPASDSVVTSGEGI